MIGIVIVGHGELAFEYLSALKHIVGQDLEIEPISVNPLDGLSGKEEEIINAIQKTDKGSGVVLVADMHGSTPANLALRASLDKNCVVLFGVNLPMLIKLLKVRKTVSLKEATNLALEAGRKYITVFKS